jgi:hypothetical protein
MQLCSPTVQYPIFQNIVADSGNDADDANQTQHFIVKLQHYLSYPAQLSTTVAKSTNKLLLAPQRQSEAADSTSLWCDGIDEELAEIGPLESALQHCTMRTEVALRANSLDELLAGLPMYVGAVISSPLDSPSDNVSQVVEHFATLRRFWKNCLLLVRDASMQGGIIDNDQRDHCCRYIAAQLQLLVVGCTRSTFLDQKSVDRLRLMGRTGSYLPPRTFPPKLLQFLRDESRRQHLAQAQEESD